MERLWADSSGQDSYDPYTCAVSSALFLECLDIAGARTLGNSLADAVAYNMTGSSGDLNKNFYAVLALEGLLDMSGANVSGHFGGDVSCSGKKVGDGAVNAYDIAALMWYQFKFEPYDQLPIDPSTVATVQGRDDTGFRCALGETRRMWQVAIGDDYCHSGQNAAMLGYDSQRRLSGADVRANDVFASSLFEAYRPGAVNRNMRQLAFRSTDGVATASWTHYARETRAPEARRRDVNRDDMLREVSAMRSLDVDVAEWAVVEGYGRWIRMRAPGVQVAMELYLAGISVDEPVHLSLQGVPSKNCTSCKPVDEDPRNVVVAFARRTEYEDDYAYSLSVPEQTMCATIVPATVQSSVMLGNTIAVRQQPPNKACGFDIFLWVPAFPFPTVHVSRQAAPFSFSARRLAATGAESAIASGSTGCDFDVGVLSGSSAMDAFRGQIQRASSCTRYGFTRPEKITAVTHGSGSSSTCSLAQATCNPSAPERNDLISRSFHSFASSGLEYAYTASLEQLLLLRTATSINAAEVALFESMLARDSGTNDCCQGLVCTPHSDGNLSNGECTTDTPRSPPVPPRPPSLPLPSPRPHLPPPPTAPAPAAPTMSEVVFAVAVVDRDGFNDTAFKLKVAWSVGVPVHSIHVQLSAGADPVTVNVTIRPLLAPECDIIASLLSANVLANATAATLALGVQVQLILQDATVQSYQERLPLAPPTPPPLSPESGASSPWIWIALAMVAVVAACAALAVYLWVKEDKKKDYKASRALTAIENTNPFASSASSASCMSSNHLPSVRTKAAAAAASRQAAHASALARAFSMADPKDKAVPLMKMSM